MGTWSALYPVKSVFTVWTRAACATSEYIMLANSPFQREYYLFDIVVVITSIERSGVLFIAAVLIA